MAQANVSLPDVDPLPGPAQSWAPGESTAGMANADSVSKGLADIKRQEIKATEGASADFSAKLDQGIAKIEQAAQHAGVSASELKSWDAEKEGAKHQTDPIAAFGSLGSVFGIIASSFTHQPFASALNASAAAINALRKGDREDYERAYKAWQDNTKVALDRHKIEQDAYQSAVELLKLNMAAGQAKMRVLAARFGDQKALFLLEHGMDKELLDTFAARDKLAMEMKLKQPAMWLANAQMHYLMQSGYDFKNPANPKNAEVLQDYNLQFGGKVDEDTFFIQNWHKEHPQGTTQQFVKDFGQYKRETSRFGALGATSLTRDRQIAADVEQMVQAYKAEHPYAAANDIADFRASTFKRLSTEAAAPSGNRIDEIKGKLGQVEIAESTIGHIEDMLKKHNAITGLGGKVTRPMEIVSNIFGGNETDRKQFERWVSELQEIAPRILLDSKGRPLSSEAGRVETIVAGLRLGDTTANTARAYYELKKLLHDIKGRLGARIGAEQPKPAPERRPSWQDAPLVPQ